MSIRLSAKALRTGAALAAMIIGAAALSGCTSIGARAFGDPTVTGSTGMVNGAGNPHQAMPTVIGSNSNQVASGPYTPPNDIGGGGGLPEDQIVPTRAASVSSQDLPVLNSSGTPAMPAQSLAPVTVGPKSPAMVTPAVATASGSHNLSVVPGANAYTHTIASGESLYTIARRYDVTAQAIVQANGFSSPDRIYVGQKVIIPGRTGAPAPAAQVAAVDDDDATQAPTVTPVKPLASTAAIADPKVLESNTPVVAAPAPQQVAAVNNAEPKMSGADKFRWPVSGKVIVDFASSKGTGINIEAPEGSAVRAAENGTVIYVGSGVEGYGNLILIRHANGYVSAYAHLKAMGVQKGDVVSRGDNIGQTGMTGSVKRPQLHFELRKGATPVDPMPLLAS